MVVLFTSGKLAVQKNTEKQKKAPTWVLFLVFL